jgi:formylmethanofuran dehydrogenase subunit C
VNSENIIGINIANGVSILIMGAVGALILTALRKAARGRSGGVSNAALANYQS